MYTSPDYVMPPRVIFLNTQLIVIVNSSGDGTHCCRTPVAIRNDPLIFPSVLTSVLLSSYSLWITVMIFLGNPCSWRILHSAGLRTQSKALQKSTKFTITGRCPAVTFLFASVKISDPCTIFPTWSQLLVVEAAYQQHFSCDLEKF